MIQTKSKLRNNNKRRTFIKKGGTKGNHPNNVYTQEYYSKDEVKHLLNLVKKNISTFREEIKSSKQMFNGEMNKILNEEHDITHQHIIKPKNDTYGIPENTIPTVPKRLSKVDKSGYLLSEKSETMHSKASGNYGFNNQPDEQKYESLASLSSSESRGNESPYALVNNNTDNNIHEGIQISS